MGSAKASPGKACGRHGADGAAPLLSVIIPALNEAENLPGLFADLQRQQGGSLEVIVGDGGSTDTTRAVVEAAGGRFVPARRGRGAQMNAAAILARGKYLLFLHADSRLPPEPGLLTDALSALQRVAAENPRVAGHFRLRFIRSQSGHELSYRYMEAKTALNRVNTTNGDQGLLLSRTFFNELGGFDESLPILEDQRIAEKIRATGTWITLPGHLLTSARRFETEGLRRRYLLMGIMMGLYSVGEVEFFRRAPGVYRLQYETGRLLLSPIFALLWAMVRQDWGLAGTLRVFYRLGRYIRQNAWQVFFFLDVWLLGRTEDGNTPCLRLHDRIVAPCLSWPPVDALVGLGCFVWYMGVLAVWFRISERRALAPEQALR